MIILTVGADRDQQFLQLNRGGRIVKLRHRAPVLERNDHQFVSSFLRDNHCSWSDIDRFIYLAVPHSKTTVRVNATLVATVAWYYNRILTIVPVDSLDEPIVATEDFEVQANFDPLVLGQLA